MDAIQPYMPWIIQGAAGAVGGNVIGALRGSSSLGPLLNTILGAAGGVGAAYGLQSGGYADQLQGLLGNNPNVANGVAGAIGGLVLPLVASFFKRGS